MDKIEILIADGFSTDGTRQIATSLGCRVIDNTAIRAEPGVAIATLEARGELAIVLAADNALANDEFVRNIVKPFADPQVVGAMPMVISTCADCLTTRYLNMFSDPFSHFLYGAAVSPWTFTEAYRIKHATPDYLVFDFDSNRRPLLAFAQGFTFRTSYSRPFGSEEDDITPAVTIIERGGDIAIVRTAFMEHHTVKGLSDFLRKFGPRIGQRLRSRSAPIWNRASEWDMTTRVRACVWPFYAISLVPTTLVGAFQALRQRRPIWLYHPVINAALAAVFWIEIGKLLVHKITIKGGP